MYEPDEDTARWAASAMDVDRDDYCQRLGWAIILATPDLEDRYAWLQLSVMP